MTSSSLCLTAALASAMSVRLADTWAEWAASLPANGQAHSCNWIAQKLSRDETFIKRVSIGMNEMYAVQMQNEVNIMSLPENLFRNIGSWLDDDREVCNMELASKAFYSALARPGGTPRRQLVLQPISAEDSPTKAPPRWYKKRILCYSQIIYEDFCGVGFNAWPLLPSLLAACAPSAELKLSVAPGGTLLAMASRTLVSDAGPEPPSFWADLQRHLTYLRLMFWEPGNAQAQFETICTLTSLRELTIIYHNSPGTYADLSRGKLVLKLPHLAKLVLCGSEDAELLLSCPKLAEACFRDTHEMRMKVKHAVLERLYLMNCKQIDLAARSPESQLRKLKCLHVSDSSELGKHIIQNIGQMQCLRTLTYQGFPAACMPTRFPQSLQSLDLRPSSWYGDLPEGLKELTNLRYLSLFHLCEPWASRCLGRSLFPKTALRLWYCAVPNTSAGTMGAEQASCL